MTYRAALYSLPAVLLVVACQASEAPESRPKPPRHDLDAPSEASLMYRTEEGTFTVRLEGPPNLTAGEPGRYEVVLTNPSRKDTDLEVGGIGFRGVVVTPGREMVWYDLEPAQSYLRLVEMKPGQTVVLGTWTWDGTNLDGERVPAGDYWAGASVSLSRQSVLSNTVSTRVND